MRELLHKARESFAGLEKRGRLDKFDSHLSDLSRSMGSSRNRLGMTTIEGELMNVLERGIDRIYGDDIALGIAIVRGRMGTAVFAVSIWPIGNADNFLEKRLNTIIRETAEWLPTRVIGSGKQRQSRSPEEYERILRELDRQLIEEKPIE